MTLTYMGDDEIFLDVEQVLRADHLHVVELRADLLFDELEEAPDGSALPHLDNFPVAHAIPVTVRDLQHLWRRKVIDEKGRRGMRRGGGTSNECGNLRVARKKDWMEGQTTSSVGEYAPLQPRTQA